MHAFPGGKTPYAAEVPAVFIWFCTNKRGKPNPENGQKAEVYTAEVYEVEGLRNDLTREFLQGRSSLSLQHCMHLNAAVLQSGSIVTKMVSAEIFMASVT